MIYKQKKLIYIHIYKTAGKTVKNSLMNIQDPTPLQYKIFNNTLGGRFGFSKQYLEHQSFKIYRNGEALSSHIRATDYKEYLGEEKYKDYFKFSFVRNPFDWQVSLYFFMKQKKDHYQHELLNPMSFEEYILWRCEVEPYHQSYFLYDDFGQSQIDFLGKVETLEKDLLHISNKYNFKLNEIKTIGASKHNDYRSYYNSTTEKLVAKTFARDFELLNYKNYIL